MKHLSAHSRPNTNASIRITTLLAGLILVPTIQSSATELTASDPVGNDQFGYSVSLSGDTALISSRFDDDDGANSGSVYVFKNLDSAGSSATENFKLTASDAAGIDIFGHAVSLSGSTALIGAYGDDGIADAVSSSGSAYIFRDLDTATGSVSESVKLTASDAAINDEFGFSVSLSGSIALVGSRNNDDAGADSGSAYVFRGVDTATGTVTENVKLTASDAAAGDWFGHSVSQSGTTALVGARTDDVGANSNSGSAYLFRDLDLAGATKTEDVKLTASDAAADDQFGQSVSLSGNTALIGAIGDNDNGSAYVFRNLDAAGSTKTQDLKLTASDGAVGDQFGFSVSQSGSTALVGARFDDDTAADSGSAYLYQNIDTATGSVTENVKITASDAAAGDEFGTSVSVSGDLFLIGAYRQTAGEGKAYSGSVSAVTTLDEGNTSRSISGISFASQDHWIIGQNTDINQVTLGAGDNADVSANGKSVFIGQNAGSDGNTLIIEGSLTATSVYIGSTSGNLDNTLQIDDGATFAVTTFYLAKDNTLSIQGDHPLEGDFYAVLGDTQLMVENASGDFELLVQENFYDLVSTTFDGQYTFLTAVPEPATYALILSAAVLLYSVARRRRS